MKGRSSGPMATLAAELEAALTAWSVPRVRSERELDRRVRDFVRGEVRRRVPALGADEVRRWVAGHGEPKPHDRYWRESKPHQNVCLWGASKTADLFVYHPEGKHSLPARGISIEVKYVPRGASYAGAIATVAGQLLAYSLRHERAIGFVLCAQPPRRRRVRSEADEDRSQALLKALPANASLIVRFPGPLARRATREARRVMAPPERP